MAAEFADDEIEGRFMEAVNEYASTCDLCGQLTMHESMTANEATQMGYCPDCVDEARRLHLLAYPAPPTEKEKGC